MKKKKKKATVVLCKISKYWKCPNVSGENKLQLCDKHFKHHKEFLAKNPSLVSKKNSQLFGIENLFLAKKKEEDKELPPDEQRCCINDRKAWNVRMRFDAEDDTSNVRKSKKCRHHHTYQVDWREKNKKKKKKRSGDGAGRSTSCTNKRRKKTVVAEYDQFSDTSDFDTSTEGGSANIRTKMKTVKRTESSGEPKSSAKSREPVVKSSNHSNCSKRRKMVTEDERVVDKTRIKPATDVTCDASTIIKGGSGSIRTKRKNVERTEGSREPVVELECLEHYKRKCFDLSVELEKQKEECTILRSKLVEVETRKATEMCLVLRSGKEKSILRCAPLRNTEKIRSEAWGMQNDVTQSGESLGTEDSDSFTDSKSSLGDLMEMMAVKYRNRNKEEEIKWKSEADMLSSFEVDPELCMKAVCALYRQKISEDEISAKGFLHCRDVVRVTSLAEFLIDGDCKGDLKKSVDELEIFDSEAVEDCKMLARSYSEQLFNTYKHQKRFLFPSYYY